MATMSRALGSAFVGFTRTPTVPTTTTLPSSCASSALLLHWRRSRGGGIARRFSSGGRSARISMSLRAGIVGLPNVGKSTLFNAIVENGKAQAANFPFCTINPNTGIVAIPDPRLHVLSKLSKSKQTVPTSIELVDIAGLVKGASKGEGLGNQFLSNIREVDSILQDACGDVEHNLHYEDGNQGQKVIQKSMDRDVISYFELVGLIEEVGFQAIDFLYYKKKYPDGRGYLAHIEHDSHVRTMISEHETKRTVELYVFRDRANIDTTPPHPPSEVNRPVAALEDDGVSEEGAVLRRITRQQRKVRSSEKLDVVQSNARYTDGHGNNEPDEAMPMTQALQDTEECVEHEDNDVLSGDGKVVNKRGRTTLTTVWNMPEGWPAYRGRRWSLREVSGHDS